MFKNLFILTCILLLSNCATPTSAFLGPIFTGAKTGSVYQASLSYGSNKIIDKMKIIDFDIVELHNRPIMVKEFFGKLNSKIILCYHTHTTKKLYSSRNHNKK